LVLVLAAGFGALAYVRRPAQNAVEFKKQAVTRGDIVQMVTANGSLTPVRNVEVGCQISGTLEDIKVDFNSRVKAGDVIAQIDPATYERALLQAEAELDNASAALELARLNFTRAQELMEDSLISRSEYDQARVNLSQAEATVRMREANVERAKVDLSRTTIYAPIDGIVISRKVEVGQTVAASLNAPTLFVIADDLTQMRIEAAVSEADVGGVTEGQRVQFTVDAFMGVEFEGIVQQVRFAPTTNQNVITYTTIVDVKNPELKLRPGMTANANIVIAERREALRVPNAALRYRPPEGTVIVGETNRVAGGGGGAGGLAGPGGAGGRRGLGAGGERGAGKPRESGREGTVYVLSRGVPGAGGEQGALRMAKVRLGIGDGSVTEVVEGLAEGDEVVTGTVAPAVAAVTPGGSPFGGGGPFGGPPRAR